MTKQLSREELMALFLKDIPTEDLVGQNIMTWLARESQRATERMENSPGDAAAAFRELQEGPMSGIAANLFAAEFAATGAVNYYELAYETPAMGPFTVTIQRVGAETAASQLAAAKAEIERLRLELNTAKQGAVNG